jgi:hypothetical protein
MSRLKILAAGLGMAALLSTTAAFAADAESCKKVRLSDVGWTDIQATTGVASVLLDRARLRAGSDRAVGAGDLCLAEEQGPRRLPRQLDAVDDRRHQGLHRRRSVETISEPTSKARAMASSCPTMSPMPASRR